MVSTSKINTRISRRAFLISSCLSMATFIGWDGSHRTAKAMAQNSSGAFTYGSGSYGENAYSGSTITGASMESEGRMQTSQAFIPLITQEEY